VRIYKFACHYKKNWWIFHLTDFLYLQNKKQSLANFTELTVKATTGKEMHCNQLAVICLFYTATPAFIDQY
jgi:hypothetical protein